MTLLPLSPDLTAGVLNTLVFRASAVLGAAWALQALLRRAPASTRHAVWNAALASLLALPLVSFVLPRWDLSPAPAPAAPATPSPMSATPAYDPATNSTVDAADAAPAHGHSLMPADETPRAAGPATVLAAFLALWALGAAFGLGRLSTSWAAARRLARRARPLTDEVGRRTLQAVAAQLGIHRDISLLVSDTLTVPVNCGLWRPAILLPNDADAWSAQRLRVVLLHELAHVRRWDYASLLAMEAARAIYWINPLVWLAARRANVELERACDDEVLRAGTHSVDYAEHLYQIAATVSAARTPSGALAMAHPSTLATRVRAILAASIDRAPLRPRALAGAAATALVIGVPLASLRLLGEGQEAAANRLAIAGLGNAAAPARAAAAWDLGHRKVAEAKAALVQQLHDSDATVRGMSAWALGNINDKDAFTPLTAALHDRDADVREMAVLALGRLGDRRAVDSLALLAVDPTMGVRGVLTHALHELGGDAAGDVLARMAQHDPDAHVRDMATWSLRLSQGARSLPVLVTLLRTGADGDRRTAAVNLAELGDARALDALAAAATRDASAPVRSAASYALGHLEVAAAAEPLATALADTVWNVRMNAAEALGATPGPRAVQALITATRDPVHQVRLTAVEALNERH